MLEQRTAIFSRSEIHNVQKQKLNVLKSLCLFGRVLLWNFLTSGDVEKVVTLMGRGGFVCSLRKVQPGTENLEER